MKESYTAYVEGAISLTRHVCQTWTSRLTGSQDCLESADFIEVEMAKCSDRVESQKFEVHPGAFLGYIRILVALYPISLFALWKGYYLLLMLLGLFSVILVVAEFFIYKEFVDPFFPKKMGKNVMGILEPEEEVKQQIIISGHHDSAHIFNFFVHQPKLYALRVLGSMSGTFLLAIFGVLFFLWDFMGEIPEGMILTAKILFGLLAIFVIQMWFFYSFKGTPGAGDNMASSATAMEAGRFFKDQRSGGKGLKHTRLILASWDSEEAGLRGARAYVREHKDMLKAIPSYNFNIECLYDSNQLFYLTTDINGFVQLSSEMAQECKDVSTELGYVTDLKPIVFAAGGTDAAEFAKEGIEATTIFGMGWTPETKSDAYHTLKDTIEAVDPKAIEATLDIIAHYVRKKDEEVSS